MTDEPKPQTDMKEEERKIEKTAETKEEKPVKTPTETKKIEEKKAPEKKDVKKKVPKVKKTEAIVKGTNIPISTKDATAICRFIKNKKIAKAVEDLEQVVLGKKAVPMKGEIPHRKGKIMSGRFPKKSSKHFIILLKSLAANANELDEPIIVEAIANFASRPYGRFGRTKKKRTHVKIIAKEKIKKENKSEEKK